MQRREFIKLFGGTVVAWPLAAHAQQAGRLPTVGFLGAGALVWGPWTAAFVGRLRELGWIEGRTIAIEYRWAEGRTERTTEIAAEIVESLEAALDRFRKVAASLQPANATLPE